VRIRSERGFVLLCELHHVHPSIRGIAPVGDQLALLIPLAKDVWLADNGVSLLIDGLVGRGSQR
jgi:hypothetical protein